MKQKQGHHEGREVYGEGTVGAWLGLCSMSRCASCYTLLTGHAIVAKVKFWYYNMVNNESL
ncbi:hypothetical protein DSLASN_30660 [Desulfoluna limicola]|uniref:Uncharacterized protein n=1 Tax=Desulfoluna limicola TaxID=2810562 RepID=A0ABM7PJK7_9BACT|nr:hypothetical protein DSLASN_30660 [Desulfoluna limicola]